MVVTAATTDPGAPVASPTRPGLRSLSPWSFAAIAVVSFGGPLALAALYGPQAVSDLSSGAGLAAAAAPAIFVLPLWIWLRYSRHVHGPSGLTGFVRAAAGPQVAVVQGLIWTVSYLLYLVYTTAYVVYDVLPAVSSRVIGYRSTLEVVLPIAIAAAVVTGRRVTVATLAVIAVGQLVLVLLLDVVAIRHGTSTSAFSTSHLSRPGQAHEFATATGDVALLFVCGSLPLFFGGELAAPVRTVRRVLPAVFALTAVVVVLGVLPLALDPAFGRAAIPGMSLVSVDVGSAVATAVGVGVAASVVGVMIVEYAALVRLGHAFTGRSMPVVARWLAVPLIVAGPVSLINPDRFYELLIKPSLIALWLSQLIVVAVYPRFAVRNGGRPLPHVATAVGASAVMLFGLWNSVSSAAST